MKVKWQSDGVISTQKVDLSGVATKAELNTEKDYTEIKANRQSWRDAINQLQAQLKEEE